MADMPEKQIEEVLWAFRERVNDLKKDRRFRYIMLFKNHGEAAGASLEHPHSQLIALPVIPKRVKEEVDAARLFYDLKERCIFCDIIRQESAGGVATGDGDRPLHGAGAVCAALPLRDLDSAQTPRIALRGCRRAHSGEPGVDSAHHAPQDRQGAGASGVQLHHPQRAGAGRRRCRITTGTSRSFRS